MQWLSASCHSCLHVRDGMGSDQSVFQCLDIPIGWSIRRGSKRTHSDDVYNAKASPYKDKPPSFNHEWTDLHYAASHGNLERIKDIVTKNGRSCLNKQDYYGKTPLYWACYKGHKDSIEMLLKYGADMNTQCRHGGTPLLSVVSLYPECALLLIKHGADVNKQDNWGVTPMYLAACNGQTEIINYLISAGALLTYRNKKTGEIPKQLTCQKDFCDKLNKLSENSMPLKDLCRARIRQCLGNYPMQKVHKLPLPESLKEYVLLVELR
ncbi:ankyrin repeat and SOCS box protein 11-like [Tubulanus polymorphus]|uniref:ankyrin repeat and SOCS box protein 11-like n=1 Tax=Tubulanus polymorphus TaxID=672921 RepID=UPI003DA305F0